MSWDAQKQLIALREAIDRSVSIRGATSGVLDTKFPNGGAVAGDPVLLAVTDTMIVGYRKKRFRDPFYVCRSVSTIKSCTYLPLELDGMKVDAILIGFRKGAPWACMSLKGSPDEEREVFIAAVLRQANRVSTEDLR